MTPARDSKQHDLKLIERYDTIAMIQLLEYNCCVTIAAIQLLRYTCCDTIAVLQVLRYPWHDTLGPTPVGATNHFHSLPFSSVQFSCSIFATNPFYSVPFYSVMLSCSIARLPLFLYYLGSFQRGGPGGTGAFPNPAAPEPRSLRL